jgi:hypothetical protein
MTMRAKLQRSEAQRRKQETVRTKLTEKATCECDKAERVGEECRFEEENRVMTCRPVDSYSYDFLFYKKV